MRLRIVTALACASMLALDARLALAQAPDGRAGAVAMPVVVKDEGAVYPKRAIDEGVTATVEVVLVVEIDAGGAVTSVAVDTAAGHGFDEAAILAANKLVLAPARRDGKPVASRIRLSYRFAPPPPRPAPIAAEAPASAREAPRVDGTIEEVEARGRRPPRETTKRTVEEREIERIPGTAGDALRSLQNMPGVARPPALAGLLIVRGSAPQDTQYFVDGTNVPLVYHFGGLSSVVPTETLDRIDFFPGNFSAQYGRAMGGIVDVGLRDPKKDGLHGLAQADLIDTRAVAEGPIGSSGWSFLVAGRRSWFDTWLGPALERAGAAVSVAPVYYDYQAVLQRDFSKRSSLSLRAFGSDDRFEILLRDASASEPNLAGTVGTHSGFWRAQAVYKSKLAGATGLRIVGAVGADYFDVHAGDVFLRAADYPVQSRVELAQRLAKTVTMNVGLDMLFAPYTVDARLPPPPKPGQPPGGPFLSRPPLQLRASDSILRPALYAEWEATPWRGARIVPGIRLDYTNDTRSWDAGPRLSARQDVTRDPRTTLKGGVGVFTQPPLPQQTNAVLGTPAIVGNNRALHYDLGVEREAASNVEVSIDGFYKQLDRLVAQGLGNVGTGVVYGVEALVRYKPAARFFGWLAYTLSRSLRRDAPGAPLHLSQFDETHVLIALGSYRVGGGWEIGARYRLTSGYNFTPQTYGFYDENVGTSLPLQTYPPYSARLPLFHSLDVRVDKTWRYAWGTLGAYLDLLNVYDQGNVLGVTYDYNYVHRAYASDLPILPSVGLRATM